MPSHQNSSVQAETKRLTEIDRMLAQTQEEEAKLDEQEKTVKLMEKRAKLIEKRRKTKQRLEMLLDKMGGDPREGGNRMQNPTAAPEAGPGMTPGAGMEQLTQMQGGAGQQMPMGAPAGMQPAQG